MRLIKVLNTKISTYTFLFIITMKHYYIKLNIKEYRLIQPNTEHYQPKEMLTNYKLGKRLNESNNFMWSTYN